MGWEARSNFLCLGCFFTGSLPGASPQAAATPSGQTDVRDVTIPHLSWILKPTNPSSRGLRQRAYQILVASSEELLSQDQGDLWDSGKMMSDQTIHVEYAGEPLSSGQKVYWKV